MYYNCRDRPPFVPDVRLMTSRELTSGYEFWSCDHFRMAVMYLLAKFDANVFIQS